MRSISILIIIGVFIGIWGVISTILFSRAVQWSKAVLEEIKRINQTLSDMKQELKELKYIADVLDGTAQKRKDITEIIAFEKKAIDELGKKDKKN